MSGAGGKIAGKLGGKQVVDCSGGGQGDYVCFDVDRAKLKSISKQLLLMFQIRGAISGPNN